VLEPGCGMGYFTLPLARMVGPAGRVIVVDIEPRMLAVLARRAHKAGLSERIVIRPAEPEKLGISDLSGAIDVALLIHTVHEMPNAGALFAEILQALKPGGQVLVIEPKGHVSAAEFSKTAAKAEKTGLRADAAFTDIKRRRLLLNKT
ncbi:MAG: class I SAM-dependent methyltransferase, partial [Planctomycetaceae bacterium]